MIRILFFIETLTGGGAEKVLRDLVNNMDGTQFDITVQTVWPCSIALVPGVHYKAMYRTHNRINHLRYRLAAATGLAYRLHIRGDYDIECAYLECGTTKIMAASTNKKAVKLAWVHCDLQRAMPDPAQFAAQTRRYYQKFDRVVCVSEDVRKSFLQLFGAIAPVDVLYNTIDDAQICAKAAMALPDGIKMPPNTVVSLGRLCKQKNYMRLLRAHKRLIDEGISHQLWIFGQGPEQEMLQHYIDENGLQASAKLMGFQANPYPVLREAALLVCSSDYEGFSTFVTEGLILGKPIVTTDCTGMRELLGDSEFGLITENSDEGLYAGMKRFLTEASFRGHYQGKASERGSDFSRQALSQKSQAYFFDAVKNKQRYQS